MKSELYAILIPLLPQSMRKMCSLFLCFSSTKADKFKRKDLWLIAYNHNGYRDTTYINPMDFLSELSTFHSERARIDIDTPFRNGEFQLEYQNKWLEMECFETKHNFFQMPQIHVLQCSTWRIDGLASLLINCDWIIWFQWIVSLARRIIRKFISSQSKCSCLFERKEVESCVHVTKYR